MRHEAVSRKPPDVSLSEILLRPYSNRVRELCDIRWQSQEDDSELDELFNPDAP